MTEPHEQNTSLLTQDAPNLGRGINDSVRLAHPEFSDCQHKGNVFQSQAVQFQELGLLPAVPGGIT